MSDDQKNKAAPPPPSPAHRAAMAQRISNSLAPPPVSIAQTEMKKTEQSKRAERANAARDAEQDNSIEIDMGDGKVSSRRNPLTESGRFIGRQYEGKANTASPAESVQKQEPVILQSQARELSASAARLIAMRRALMEGQDQAGVFKLPGPGTDNTEQS
ncbi:MAG: hypothetical protein JST01_03565 [Cyanobacteria bacterium SZAS TMP-1]|nr:hypothetical protein [Cyanobacteria bacterium SZAS TMP-1]